MTKYKHNCAEDFDVNITMSVLRAEQRELHFAAQVSALPTNLVHSRFRGRRVEQGTGIHNAIYRGNNSNVIYYAQRRMSIFKLGNVWG